MAFGLYSMSVCMAVPEVLLDFTLQTKKHPTTCPVSAVPWLFASLYAAPNMIPLAPAPRCKSKHFLGSRYFFSNDRFPNSNFTNLLKGKMRTLY